MELEQPVYNPGGDFGEKRSDQKPGTEPFNMGAFRVMMTEPETQKPQEERRCPPQTGHAVSVPGL